MAAAGLGRGLGPALALAAALCLAGAAASAQAGQGSDAAGSGSGSGGSDAMGDLESGFFGEGEGMAAEAAAPKVQDTYSEELLKAEPMRLGGDFELKVTAGTGWKKDYADWSWDYLRDGYSEASYVDLKSSLFFSARPGPRLRYYGKAKVEYPFSSAAASSTDLFAIADGLPSTSPGAGVPVPAISIWELFADVELGDRVFVRAGKQMVKWGVGYFFQPADVISLTSVDIYDPTAEREGPVAIKANLALGKNNLDFYAIAPAGETIDSIQKIGLAGRAQVVLGGFELGAGAAYQKSADWQFIGTASGSAGKFALFGEGALKRKSPGKFIASDATIRSDRVDWFLDATGGATYVEGDAYLTVTGQYYYNGEGYADARTIGDSAAYYLGTGALSLSDVLGNTGRHYVGVNASWSIKKNSKLALGAMWIGDLSDGSGTARPQATIDFTDELQLVLFTTLNYGGDKTQFRGISALGEAFVIPLASVGATLSIATGRF